MEPTNADRVLFPGDGITKGDVFDYYSAMADRLLPFVAGRALTIERYPKGISGGGFMQKNAPDHYPVDVVGRYRVSNKVGGTTTYPVVDSPEGIAFFANLSAITFHVPPTVIEDTSHPDWIIWDLDPPPDRVSLVRSAAHALRGVLDQFSIPTLVMTSGSKGYHLRTPLDRTAPFELVSEVARGTAAIAEAAHPDLLTLAFRKADRGDRVFVDWLRNAPLSTSVAPWSLRARPGASVAAPLLWDEVDAVAPDSVGLRTAPERLRVDPWGGFKPIDLTPMAVGVRGALEDAGIKLKRFDRFRS